MFLFEKKRLKERKNTRKLKKKKKISPNLLTKTGIFFFSIAALIFRVPEQVDFKNTNKQKKRVSSFPRDALKLRIPLPRHCTWLNQHTSFSFKNITSHQKKKENKTKQKKKPSAFSFSFVSSSTSSLLSVCVSTVATNSLNTEASQLESTDLEVHPATVRRTACFKK